MTGFYGMAYLMTGKNPSRQGNSPNGSPSVGLYEASDAPFYIACANDRLYRRLVIDVLNRPDLAGESAAFISLNRGKRGITLDLTKPAACEVARELITRADVVVENFSSGVMKKYGLDYAAVAPGNPRLVYCSISAYGRQGPFASRPGFDPITQAESGFMSLNGFPDGEPVRTGSPIVDMATGMSACNAILLALIARDRLGRGQQVEVALIDTAVAMTGFYGMAYLINGNNPGRFGNSPNGSPTVGVYRASDGPLYMACANDRLYRRLVTDVLERPDLVDDPDFATNIARCANREVVDKVVIYSAICLRPRWHV